MKKWICLLLTALLLTGCASGSKTQAAKVEGSMEELINQMYENHKELEMPIMTMPVATTDTDSISYNLGLENGDQLTDAAISEPMMGQPMSLILVRVKDGADAREIAKKMYDGIDTRKWICQEADTKTAAVYGDVALFFMVNSEFNDMVSVDSVLEAFKTVCGGEIAIVA